MKTILKIILPLAVFAGISSCNDRVEGDEIISIDAVKIDSVSIPQDTMDVFSTQTIKTFSEYTTGCEGFYGYDYVHSDTYERKVSTYKFKTDADCGNTLSKPSQINFRPIEAGNYSFLFWAGTNTSGEDLWIEKIIVVQ